MTRSGRARSLEAGWSGGGPPCNTGRPSAFAAGAVAQRATSLSLALTPPYLCARSVSPPSSPSASPDAARPIKLGPRPPDRSPCQPPSPSARWRPVRTAWRGTTPAVPSISFPTYPWRTSAPAAATTSGAGPIRRPASNTPSSGWTRTVFVDLADPMAPAVLGKLPTATDPSTWRDIKVYADHAFIVSEAPQPRDADLRPARTSAASKPTPSRVTFDDRRALRRRLERPQHRHQRGEAASPTSSAPLRGEGLPMRAAPGFHVDRHARPAATRRSPACFSDADHDGRRAPARLHARRAVRRLPRAGRGVQGPRDLLRLQRGRRSPSST